eukprot:151946_1
MYETLMDPRLQSVVGDYSFLKVQNKMKIKVDKPIVLFGSNKDANCYLTYERPFFDSVITHSGFGGWSASVKKYEITQKNMYQLAVIVLIDLMVFNYDRTTFRKGIAGHQHEENMMLHTHGKHFSFLPIDNSWGLLFLQASEGELEDWVKRFHDTIRYALDDMRRFAKEYMEHSAKPFFKGFELTPFALLFGTAQSVMKGWENPETIKEFVQKFEFVWNDEIGRIVVENIKKEAMRLDEYLVEIRSRYDELKCGKLSEADVQSVKRIQQNILKNVKIFDEQNKKQWVPLKTQNAMNGYDDMYGEDLEQKYEDVNRLMTRLSFLKGYVSGYRKGRNGENM